MTYKGEVFGSVDVAVDRTKSVVRFIASDVAELSFDEADALATFITDEIYAVKKARGDYDV